MNTAARARLRQLEAAVEKHRPPESADLDEAAIVAEWRELSRHPSPPRPLPPELAAMSDVEAVEEFRRLIRHGRAARPPGRTQRRAPSSPVRTGA